MRFLGLSQWCWPEPDVRVLPLARGLVKRGNQVTVLTGLPNYPQGKIYPGYRAQPWQWETHDGVRVLRLPLVPDHSRSSLWRSLSYLSFAASTCTLGPWLCGQADAMFVYHPPLTVGLPAMWISLLRRIPYVFEVQDMWPETLLTTGMANSHLLYHGVGALAKLVYRRAAAITVISPGFKRNLIEKGVPAGKIHVIPNWADDALYRPLQPDPKLKRESGMEGRFNVVFAGNMGPAQALGTVLDAAQGLRDLLDVQFVFIGDGIQKPELQARVREAELKNVRFLDRQPAERMAEYYALADVLLVHLQRDPLFEITIPSKTQAYLACGKPILMAVRGDAAEIVRSAGAGLVCPAENPTAMAEMVRQFYSMPSAQLQEMGKRGRKVFLEQFSQEALLERFEQLLTSVALGKDGVPVASSSRRARTTLSGKD
jgi:colanic acid biosynthesis glycosyl transferase WcaI